MGSRERREREKDELRGKILEAARCLFIREGYDSVSMRKIAEAIEYSPTAIYQHFKDKAALVLALCENDFAEWGQRFFALKSITDPVERLRAAAREYIRFAIERPSHYRLMFMSDHIGTLDPAAVQHAFESDDTRGDPDRDSYAFVVHTIKAGMEQGLFRDADPYLTAQTVWCALHGLCALYITHRNDPWPQWRPIEQRIDFMIDTLIGGLRRNIESVDSKGQERWT